MALHEVQLKGYSVRPGNLSLGTFDSYGIEQLHVTLDDTWSGLAVTATFNPPKGEPVEIRVPENGLIDVPAEATANEGTGSIVYCGVANGVQLITKTQGYNVITHANVGGTEPFNPSESLATQVLQAALNAEKNSVEAKSVADGLRNDAANGKFDGKDGAKGADGVSPTASVTQTDDGAEFTVTDASGTTTATIRNGTDGKDGAPGAAGKDAVVDATLTQDGQAADAKVTGEKIGKLKENTAALQKRQNVLIGSETGNPASCNDAYSAPLCGLTVYGKSTQDGTPTPDAPVPIVSAGDDGSVVVKVTGKNRMPPNLKKNDVVECPVKKNTQVTVVFKGNLVSQGGNILFLNENNEQQWLGIDKGKAEYHATFKTNLTKFKYLLEDMDSENVCMTWNASSPDYEPYCEQLLTLPTPNGLPGIPVTSGGNYTDQNGQQWICDEVDLERGVRVQRVTTIVFSDQTKFTLRTTSTSSKFRFSAPADGLKTANLTTADSSVFCSALALGKQGSTWTIPNTFTIDADGRLYVRFENINSLDELQQYLQRTPMSLTAILATPIETPLTPAEIAAYKALTTYAPDTVVQASDGAGIKLDYQRDVNLVVKNLEDAIASMTTT